MCRKALVVFVLESCGTLPTKADPLLRPFDGAGFFDIGLATQVTELKPGDKIKVTAKNDELVFARTLG